MGADAMVVVEGLRCQFDVSRPWLNRIFSREGRATLTAVADVSFSIPRRKTFALVGESGSGKSTIAKTVVGLIRPTRGNISIDGVSMTEKAESARRQQLRRRIQMIFQDPYASLNPRWRVRRILAEPLRVFGLEKDPRNSETRVQELLRLVGLDSADAAKFPHEFSGGQRQRIAIARAIAAEPAFIVCDEPTSALDVCAGANFEPDARAAGATRANVLTHQPQPCGGASHGKRHWRSLSGTAGRVGATQRVVRPPASPLYPNAARRRARSRVARPPGAPPSRRRGGQSNQPAEWLRIPSTVSIPNERCKLGTHCPCKSLIAR